MQKDYEKLEAACCAPTAPVTIMRAPKPNTFVETNMSDYEEQELETYLL